MASGGQVQNPNTSQPSNGDMLAYLQKIDGRLDNIEKRLDDLETFKQTVSDLDKDMKKLWARVEDKFTATTKRVKTLEEQVENDDFRIDSVNGRVLALESERADLKEEIVYLQSQSMRNNLIFTNIPEASNESNEDTEVILRQFIHEKMKIAHDLVTKIKFERVHRMGPRNDDGIRKIVAKFHEFKDREMVKKEGKALKGSNLSVFEQYPREIMARRRKLVPKLKAAKENNKTAWISYDTLYIEGKPVRDNDSPRVIYVSCHGT